MYRGEDVCLKVCNHTISIECNCFTIQWMNEWHRFLKASLSSQVKPFFFFFSSQVHKKSFAFVGTLVQIVLGVRNESFLTFSFSFECTYSNGVEDRVEFPFPLLRLKSSKFSGIPSKYVWLWNQNICECWLSVCVCVKIYNYVFHFNYSSFHLSIQYNWTLWLWLWPRSNDYL